MKLNFSCDVIHHRRYRIRAQYPTAEAEAQSRMKTLQSLIETYFCRGLRVDNLQTGALVTENLEDGADKRSYSSALLDEWLAKQNSYFFVGRSVAGDDYGHEPGIYWGARPPASRLLRRPGLRPHAGPFQDFRADILPTDETGGHTGQRDD